jgi:hypothetical protein
MNISSENIVSLNEGEIFVFGSNTSGRHGAGAALHAKKNFGAIQGQGEGLQGHSYGLPTKNHYIETLPLEEIKKGIDRFYSFAMLHPELKFLVTEIGCGRANYKPDNIAMMFADASKLNNVYLPKSFWNILVK